MSEPTDETTTSPPPGDTGAAGGDGEVHPRGTFFLMVLFLMMIAAMWLWMYVLLLQRG